jgi:ribonuclease HII
VDEVGVGPLAGPVVAAAVVLPKDFRVAGVRDSKLIDEAERARLEADILDACLDVGFGSASVQEIDEIGIYGSGTLAMKRAVEALSESPHYLLVDARHVDLDLAQEGPVRGDRDHTCIAAASIVAKQHRDRLMIELHGRHPQYGFDQHKGYPTKRHLTAIARHGASSVHRVSWLAVREAAGQLSPLYYRFAEEIRGLSSARSGPRLRERLAGVRLRLDVGEYDRLCELLRRRCARV